MESLSTYAGRAVDAVRRRTSAPTLNSVSLIFDILAFPEHTHQHHHYPAKPFQLDDTYHDIPPSDVFTVNTFGPSYGIRDLLVPRWSH
jgi:hypothetical protein